MELEMEVKDEVSVAAALLERLAAAAGVLEQTADRLAGREIDLEASFGRVASRETELEQRLADAEATIAGLKAGRKTVSAGVPMLQAKQGEPMQTGAIDAALTSLSVEQRIAVKAQLMRAGLLG